MPNSVNSTGYSEKVKKVIDSPIAEEPLRLFGYIGVMLPDDSGELAEKYPIFRFDYFNNSARVNIPWVGDSGQSVSPLKADADPDALKENLKVALDDVEKRYSNKLGAGDETLREFGDAILFHPAKRALDGWTAPKICEKLNTGMWRNEFVAYLNIGLTDKARKQLAYSDVYFPINRLAVSADHVEELHLDYFDRRELGNMTAQDEREYRTQIMEAETQMLGYLQQVTSITDPQEGERIKELTGVGNPAQQFNRYARRGIKNTFSDTEARIAGIKNGWPIEDLNALSSFKAVMDVAYINSHYEEKTMSPVLRQTPVFAPGEREYLGKMQKLWAKIESTKVQNNETRMQLLGELRDVIKEGYDKEFIRARKLSNEDPNFCYALYDIDRKIARQLSPAELEVMNSGLSYDEERVNATAEFEANEQRIRREEYEERERLDAERRELEAAQKQQQEEEKQRQQKQQSEQAQARENEVRAEAERRQVAYNPDRYDRIIEDARQRRENAMSPEDIERERLVPDGKGEKFFYHMLEEKRREANRNAPINMVDRTTTVQDDILRFYMGK
ncbi:MAG: hypothetical protein K6C95_01690, partial [Lachnospiraceae bacterium]|nr:hypothetical protein [Lachnospiraceae bacterium]